MPAFDLNRNCVSRPSISRFVWSRNNFRKIPEVNFSEVISQSVPLIEPCENPRLPLSLDIKNLLEPATQFADVFDTLRELRRLDGQFRRVKRGR